MGWRCWQRARLIGCPLSWCFPVLEQTHGTAAVRCAISGAHGCKWGSGREKGVGCVCVCPMGHLHAGGALQSGVGRCWDALGLADLIGLS